MPTAARYSTKKKPARKPSRWLALVIPLAVLIFFGAGGLVFAANMEERDAFCASCHTQPESTFFTRSQAKKSVDLATAHFMEGVKCIDCHSGSGFTGRLSAMMMGAHNALAYVTNTAVQPAVLTSAIADDNCIKCHAKVFRQAGFDNHYHEFLSRWQSRDPSAANCVTCHASHDTNGQADIAFLDKVKTEEVCQRCHNALGEGEIEQQGEGQGD